MVEVVYYAKLHLWVVIKAVLEVVVNVGGPFVSVHHMHFEERIWYISLLLNGELDSAR